MKQDTSLSYSDKLIKSPKSLVLIGILAIVMGIFLIVSQRGNKPISRDEAVAYSGKFEKYEISKNYCGICFQDGTVQEVYPHTETGEFREKMQSLPKGTRLRILVNPNNTYVVEIKTKTEELLNFEKSQQDIDSYDNGYIVLGVFICISGVFMIFYAFMIKKNKQNEEQRRSKSKKRNGSKKSDSDALRYADMNIKSRILLQAEVGKYNICYRRVKTVNELIVNGVVYDEIKAIIEFEHELSATVDKHQIRAGYDDASYSYIEFDGEIVEYKRRII